MKNYLKKIVNIAFVSSFMTLGSFAQDTVSYKYDALGRLTTVTYSSGAVITYTYDAVGNRISKIVTGASASGTKVVVLPIAGFVVIPIS